MLTITKAAQNEVNKFFEQHNKGAIRIFLHEGGCGGPQLAMGVDEKKKDDQSFAIGGVEYLIETKLLKDAQPLEIDFAQAGFKITSNLALGGGGCSGCSSSDSCSQ